MPKALIKGYERGETVLEARGITKHFPGVLANDHIDFQIKAGEIHAILWENGGKTTLMKILFGEYQPDEGEIYIGGMPVKFRSPLDAIDMGIGMVHQNRKLVPAHTVIENIILRHPRAGKILNLKRAEDYRPDDGVFGQRRDTLANPLWNLYDVSLYSGMYADLFAITDCSGGAIGLGWHQFDFSIRSFKVSRNGILGEVITNIDDEYQLTFPEELVLYQNFPNPFNSSTAIRFQLHQENEISIDLYNVLGEKIQTIVEGFYSKGIHSFDFSSGELSSGIYRYRLQMKTKSLTKKLIIIK